MKKKYIIIILILTLLTGCNTKKEKQENNNNYEYHYYDESEKQYEEYIAKYKNDKLTELTLMTTREYSGTSDLKKACTTIEDNQNKAMSNYEGATFKCTVEKNNTYKYTYNIKQIAIEQGFMTTQNDNALFNNVKIIYNKIATEKQAKKHLEVELDNFKSKDIKCNKNNYIIINGKKIC